MDTLDRLEGTGLEATTFKFLLHPPQLVYYCVNMAQVISNSGHDDMIVSFINPLQLSSGAGMRSACKISGHVKEIAGLRSEDLQEIGS